jgi:hypothetical protein
LLRQGDAKVFKKYSQMKLQMKREALIKLNRQANEQGMNQDISYDTARGFWHSFDTVSAQFAPRTGQIARACRSAVRGSDLESVEQ